MNATQRLRQHYRFIVLRSTSDIAIYEATVAQFAKKAAAQGCSPV